jgi:MoxR-like ATPase
MFTTPLFDPTPKDTDLDPEPGEARYVYGPDGEDDIAMAVNVAMATDRPLLVTGNPGSGKSTLAADVARLLKRAYVGTVVTSRTRLTDLVAEIDLVTRLNDAQARTLRDHQDADYLVPGALWWAIDPDTAKQAPLTRGQDPRRWADNAAQGTVLLLDELDKAEPDLPNDLLGPLGDRSIDIPFHGRRTAEDPLLIIVTSNRERDMPPAFLRRCLHLQLKDPGETVLADIAAAHYDQRDDDLYLSVAKELVRLQKEADKAGRRPPSTAEYLDAVQACIRFQERPGSARWAAIERAALSKITEPDDPAGR